MSEQKNTYDYVIVGAGIVGMSLAYELIKRSPNKKIAILEKEPDIGVHASGRNSGVLHCGIFYREDSLKAKVCSIGAKRMSEFAKLHDIPCVNGGKVVVPTSEENIKTLDVLMQNAKQNNVAAHLIDEKELLKLEPYAAPASKAIYCPSTSVIDNKAVLKTLKKLLIEAKVDFIHDCKVTNVLTNKNCVMSSRGVINYGYLFNCAGAYADQIAKMEGLAQDYTLLPFKGIYYKMTPQAGTRVKSNIYPVPNVATPFLGVHFTRSIHDDVYVGPTAIPVFGRENYHRLQGVSLSETSELSMQLLKLFISNENGFRNIAKNEMMKYSKKVFFEGAKKLMPSLKMDELISCSKVGIRPQLMNKKKKALEMDYIFEKTKNSIHVLNAISPAFTSSFAFADMILEKADMI
jgi:L-2-hydroxyglutarate oxidase